ncbi:dephospho-CoA kinase [Latilactobacillus curvatus]|jgi:dephospho-CoA kinase|uniref:Dephospho-CoA kinase n=2 Tax=Latilactobacillus curvatus TaxID=28038 RepID=A0A1B2A5V2_LATCU|nr:dephospho-CoA kinase [Latilactobacillus curvatus]ANJ69754.1 dephospho-CoA kinase [Latilactobacillus curvatus]ANY13406.1 dephospho-CoA kinase [Latilactobacillus curvatus]AOO75074.1 dephospho-CoA kinase [Latilactobacillus curvatus]AWV72578.1 dephospho-CoA kinase [Latilactobacillus curvatus]AXN35481.1 dephospho-CoA kinase [Latilactobacillus curvatus]
MTYFLGLTGGIASGKSTVAALFKEQGIPVIDADQVAHQVLATNKSVQAQLQAAFGEAVVKNGQVDRPMLGQQVFGNPEALTQLNAITGPAILTAIKQQMQAADAPLVVLDVPLLYEQHYEQYCDGVAVVYVERKTQLQRLMARNQLTIEQANARIDSQSDLATKKARADFVIDNQGTPAMLRQRVLALLQQLCHNK